MYEIEKGVPIPKPRGGGAQPIYPWLEMQVGDSFFVADANITSFASQVSRAGKKYGRRFTCRTEDGGVRVWRTE